MPREERERRYIAEYMAQTYPRGNYQLNVPLGPIPQELVRQLGNHFDIFDVTESL